MFSRGQFLFKGQVLFLVQLHFRDFWFASSFNIFLLCVLIFDVMLDMHELLNLIVFLLIAFLYLCIGGICLLVNLLTEAEVYRY